MFNLIKSEFLKLKSNRNFYYVLLAICVSSLMQVTNWAYYASLHTKAENYEYGRFGIYAFVDSLDSPLYILLFFCIFICAFICNDFEQKTLHASIYSGHSRFSILISKSIACYISMIIMMIPTIIIYTVTMTIMCSFGTSITVSLLVKCVKLFVLSALINGSFISYSILFSYILKKSAQSIIACIILTIIVPITLDGVNSIISSNTIVSKYILFNMYNMINLDITSTDFYSVILICLIHIIGLFFITNHIFKKAQLK